MAQTEYMQDSGQEGMNFQQWSYDHAEWAGGVNFPFSAENFTQQPSILNQNDAAALNDFFDNPETTMVSELPVDWTAWQNKVGQEGMGGQLDGFDHDAPPQTIDNPGTTLGGASHSRYQTHATSIHEQTLPNFLSHPHAQSSDNEVKAASSLFNMSQHGHGDPSDARAFINNNNGDTGFSTWGNMASNYNNLSNMHVQDNANYRSPVTTSGRQSANSHSSQQQQMPLTTNQYLNNQRHQQAMQQYWLMQQQQAHIGPAARQPQTPLQLETGQFDFFHPYNQTRMVHSAGPNMQGGGRPSAPPFGSDPAFSNRGYQAPSSARPLEREKGANLNNVPFADLVAANGQTHLPPFTPLMQHRPYQQPQYPVSSGSRLYNTTSTQSSPGNMGGLPLGSSASNLHSHGHPINRQMVNRPADEYDDEVSEDGSEIEELQPRKRRKSQMELDDEAEFSPSIHAKAPLAKRKARVSKAANLDGSEDDYDDEVEDIKPVVKRRASSAAGRRLSLSSSHNASPITSPAGDTPASNKRKSKSRNSQASRQNLTEAQKRENHIMSEKSRRDQIKTHYYDLETLVPGLKQGKAGLSRSDVLAEIVSYIEITAGGNEAVEEWIKTNAAAPPKTGGGGSG